ncbi:hypothetical protein DNTS_021323 [Danionella cerebrum]|uniref:BEN domain-containing protein n=1 Tax=Danionella cerebrum TaxID=2873325 RepID=A0A553MNZ2_9TELE|nr:hypothetical protein DNTS_021323 [Danionella translucida]
MSVNEMSFGDILSGVKTEEEEIESVQTVSTASRMMRPNDSDPLSNSMATYGAILKLDEKFEMLQAKFANIQNCNVQAQREHLSSDPRESGEPQLSKQVLISDTSSMSRPLLVSFTTPPPPMPSSGGPQEPSSTAVTQQIHCHISDPPGQNPPEYKRMSLMQRKDSTKTQHPPAPNTIGEDGSSIEAMVPRSVLQSAGRMIRPALAVRYLSQKIFTPKELSQCSTSRNLCSLLKRLDPKKINAIRGQLQSKEDSAMDGSVSVSSESSGEHLEAAAEVDIELSESDSEQNLQQRKTLTKEKSEEQESNCGVYLGPSHRGVKVPENVLSAAHLRKRPELIARYLIKVLFPEEVLLHSNVYGGPQYGIQALDPNRISALRGQILVLDHLLFQHSFTKVLLKNLD